MKDEETEYDSKFVFKKKLLSMFSHKNIEIKFM